MELVPSSFCRTLTPCAERLWDAVLIVVAISSLIWLVWFIRTSIEWVEIGEVTLLGLATAIRVLILILIASLIWVPIGVWIGLRPGISDRAQAIVQFMAAFPANLFFPIAVTLILRYQL